MTNQTNQCAANIGLVERVLRQTQQREPSTGKKTNRRVPSASKGPEDYGIRCGGTQRVAVRVPSGVCKVTRRERRGRIRGRRHRAKESVDERQVTTIGVSNVGVAQDGRRRRRLRRCVCVWGGVKEKSTAWTSAMEGKKEQRKKKKRRARCNTRTELPRSRS